MLSVVLLMFKSYFKVMPKHRNTLQLLILFLTCVHCFSQSRTITVKDAVTNEALPFASINLLKRHACISFETDINIHYQNYTPKHQVANVVVLQ